MGHLAPEVAIDPDTEHGSLPKTELPGKIDASAWGEALAYDRELIASVRQGPAAEAEVDAAFRWLADHQAADGSWKGDTADETVELTALSVLALNGAEAQGLATRKGLAFLRSRQRDSGAIGGGSPESHAIAALALLEASIRTHDGSTVRAATKAIGLVVQQNQGAPWGKGVVAGWHYHVLRLAVASGDRALTPLLVRGHEARAGEAREIVAPADQAADACAALWTNPAPDRAQILADAAWVLNRTPLPGTDPTNFPKNDLRLAYFASTLLRPLGGDAWTKWWSPLRAKLVKAQGADGSWPAGFEQGKGQIYVTALSVIILQTPRRLPPLAE